MEQNKTPDQISATLNNIDSRDSRLGELLRSCVTDWESFEAEQVEARIQDNKNQFTRSFHFHGYEVYTHYQNHEEGQTFELNSGRLIQMGIACINRVEGILNNGRSWNSNRLTSDERIILDLLRTGTLVGGCMKTAFENMIEVLPNALALSPDEATFFKNWSNDLISRTQPAEV